MIARAEDARDRKVKILKHLPLADKIGLHNIEIFNALHQYHILPASALCHQGPVADRALDISLCEELPRNHLPELLSHHNLEQAVRHFLERVKDVFAIFEFFHISVDGAAIRELVTIARHPESAQILLVLEAFATGILGASR